MEGISHEAASLAGHLGLGRLVYVYDDNHITIDGPTELSYTDDVAEALRGLRLARRASSARSPNDLDALEAGLREAHGRGATRPTLLVLRTHIGYPSPKYTDTANAHGNPLGADEVAASRRSSACPPEDFFVPDDVLDVLPRGRRARRAAREAWEQRRAACSRARARAAPTSTTRASRGAALAGLGAEAADVARPGEQSPTRVACEQGRSTRSSTSCPG